MEINIEELTKSAFSNIVKEAAKQVIVEHIGSGINSPNKRVIVKEAERLLREDKELNVLLKNRIKYWISKE